jgi:hypothetical protein
MKKLKTLVLMQIRDLLSSNTQMTKKSKLRLILLGILKFLAIAGGTYLVLYLLQQVGIFYYSEAPVIMILLITLVLCLSILSCTFSLMQNLYFSEDNKVLITLPVTGNNIFLSKIIVFYLYEIKRNLDFLFPIVYACEALMVARGLCGIWIFVWSILPLLLIVALPVLIGSLLSIPLMYIYRFFKKHSIVEIVSFFLVLCGVVGLTVYLISLIPENIDLINQWPTISKYIHSFFDNVEKKLVLVRELVLLMTGDQMANLKYSFTLYTLLRFGILLVTCVVLVLLVYFSSRPLFFGMMSKNFEFDKNAISIHKNVRHNRYFTLIKKEWIISFRSLDISLDFVSVYLLVPILILLLNKIYAAMETKTLGDIMTYSFNLLMITLPLLASNGIVATMYSREGRAGYIKKTKPMYAAYPLGAKLVLNVILSIPSIVVATSIFGSFTGIGILSIVLISLAVFFLYLAHMIWSAMMDVMNPQNEQYATTGNDISNPNETKSSILAFFLAAVFALIGYKFFSESLLQFNNVILASVKLFLCCFVLCAAIASIFLKKIRAYYYDR